MGTNTYRLIENGYEYCDDYQAECIADAMEEARLEVDRANYDCSGGTTYVDVTVICDETGEEESETVELQPDEPDCADGSGHDWQRPHDVVGGLEENPGVQGHGGGVIIREVCAVCGVHRVTDTWGQRPDTGEQGLVQVRYEAVDVEDAR